MSILTKLRRGQGPFWGTLKRLANRILGFHIPVVPVLTRPLFGLLYHLHVAAREGGIWALRFFWFEPLFRSQCVSVGVGFRMEHLPYITGSGRIVLGAHVSFAGKPSLTFSNRIHNAPELVIGDNTFVGHDCSINVAQSVRIGKHCLLAAHVRIADFDGHQVDALRRRAKEPAPPAALRPVVIGDDVWIGTGSIILKGIHIGDRSIVGAGSVVTRDVPPDVVVAGNPARVVKHLAGKENGNGILENHASGKL